MRLRQVMCRAGDQAYWVAGEVPCTEAACVRPANACPTRRAAGLALGALKLPDMRCIKVVCEADALEAAAPGALESGDPASCAAVCGEAAADAGVAESVRFEAALATLGDAPLPGVLDVLPRSALSVWLMSTSCSRLFTCTSWLMYSLGSVSAVGSWFCISVTSRVRKSLAEIVAELSFELSELLVLLVPDVELAMGVAALRVSTCPAVIW
jgi:hypothetical protein